MANVYLVGLRCHSHIDLELSLTIGNGMERLLVRKIWFFGHLSTRKVEEGQASLLGGGGFLEMKRTRREEKCCHYSCHWW